MFAKVRLAGALGALVTAAVAGTVGWHGASASPADGSVELRSTAEPMSTTMKSPIVATTDPSPFDPCNDIPFDAVQRLGLAYTPPEAEEGLRCHYDAGNYQLAVEPITWRSYAQTLPSGRLTCSAATTFAAARTTSRSSVLSAAAAGNKSRCSGRTRCAWLCATVGNNKNSPAATSNRFSPIPPLRNSTV